MIVYYENPIFKNICKSEGNQDKPISILESWNIYIYIYEKKGYEKKNSLKLVSLVLKKNFFFLNSLWFIVGLKFHHNGLNLLSTVDNMVKTYI